MGMTNHKWISYECRYDKTRKQDNSIRPIREMIYLAIKRFENSLCGIEAQGLFSEIQIPDKVVYRGNVIIIQDYYDEIYIRTHIQFLDFVMMDDCVSLESHSRTNDEEIYYADANTFNEEYLMSKIVQFYNYTPVRFSND